MKAKKLYILTLISMVSLLSFGQTYKSELITFDNKNLVELIQGILKTKNNCGANSNSHNWYIESRIDGSFIVSINRIGNLLQSLEDKNIYTTIINNKLVFYITQNENNPISKTGYFIDLGKYSDYEYVFFEDFSVWQIKKIDDAYKISNKKIWKCQ